MQEEEEAHVHRSTTDISGLLGPDSDDDDDKVSCPPARIQALLLYGLAFPSLPSCSLYP